MAGLQTEYSFTLPKGYVDPQGGLHREGRMRLATARDEIEPLRDSRAANADDPYLTILVLSRVVSQLGSLESVTPEIIEGLFAADLAFLQDFYGIINFGDPSVLESAPAPPAVSETATPTTTGAAEQEDDTGSGDDPPAVLAERSRRRASVEEMVVAAAGD